MLPIDAKRYLIISSFLISRRQVTIRLVTILFIVDDGRFFSGAATQFGGRRKTIFAVEFDGLKRSRKLRVKRDNIWLDGRFLIIRKFLKLIKDLKG